MTPIDRRTAFARHTQWLALALEALVLLSLLAGALPLTLSQPVWWLRLFDAAMNLAPVLLLAVILLALGRALLYNDSSDVMSCSACSPQPTPAPCPPCRPAPCPSANRRSMRQSPSTPPGSASASKINTPRSCAAHFQARWAFSSVRRS